MAFVVINSNDPTQHTKDSFENVQRVAQEKGYPLSYLFDETQHLASKMLLFRAPFPSLTGRLQTVLPDETYILKSEFPSLTGRLQTEIREVPPRKR